MKTSEPKAKRPWSAGPASERARRGAIAVITAVMLPVFVGAVALAVDTGVIYTARAQLQTAADSAALAGAARMAERQRLQAVPLRPGDISAAHVQATAFASHNRVLGRPATLRPNPSNANGGDADLVVGYLSRPFDRSQVLNTDPTAIPYYNAVQVRAVRSAERGDAIPNFFSAIWSRSGFDLGVTSTAAVVGISGFRAVDTTTNANVLPIVLDKDTFAAMMQGTTTDQFTVNLATNTVTPGADGITESRLFPVRTGNPGNWGTINIGVSNNSTSTLGAQIRHGVTPAQLATYPNGEIRPDPVTGTIRFGGNPGISAGLKDDLRSIIGKPVRIPIYDASLSGGNGNNAMYTVVAFAPARVLSVNFRGKDKFVVVQPTAPATDLTAVWGGLRDGPMTDQVRLVLVR